MAGVEVGTAYLSIVPSFRGGERTLARQVSGSMGTVGATAGQSLSSKMLGTAGKALKTGFLTTGAAVAGIFGTAVVKGFQRLNAIEQAQAKLKGLGNSANDVKSIMDNALASVKGTAFGLDEAATVAASATAAGVKPGKELTKYLKLTADAATIAGTSMGDMGSILNKVTASGMAHNDSLQQLSDQGIPIYQMLGKELNRSAGDIFNMASKGMISAEQLQTALQKGVGGSALSAGDTVQGAFKNAGAALSRFGAAFLEKLFPHFQKSLVNITTFLDNMTDAVGPVASAIGDVLGPAMERVTGAMANWDPSGVVDFFKNLKSGTGSMQSFASLGERIGPVLKSIMGALPSLASGVGKGFVDFWNALQPSLESVGAAAGSLGGTLGKILGTALKFVADHIDTIMKFLPGFIAAWWLYRKAQQATATAQLAYNSAALAALPLTTANNALRVIAAGLERSQTRAQLAATLAQQGSNAATAEGNVIQSTSLIRLAAMKAAQLAASVASKAMAAGQWLVNAAMSANPIGLIIAGLVALAVGLTIAWKRSSTFRAIVQAALNGVKAVAQAVGDWFTGKFVPFFTETLPGAGRAVLDWFKANWPYILGILTGPIGTAVVLVVKNWDKIKGAFSAAKGWVSNTWRKAWGGVSGWISGAVSKGKDAASGALTRTRNAFSSMKDWTANTWKKGWASAKNWIHDPVGSARNLIAQSKDRIQGTFNALDGFGRKVFGKHWDGMKAVLRAPVDGALAVFRAMFGAGGKFRTVLSGFIDAAKSIFGRLKGAVTNPIRTVIDLVNHGLIKGGINWILNKLGVPKNKQVPWIPVPKFAGGTSALSTTVLPGYTPGRDVHRFYSPTGGAIDLSGGEGIARPELVRAIGASRWDAANAAAARGRVADGVRYLGGFARGTSRVWPTNTRRLSPTYPGHSGVDIAAGMGAPIFATESGRIAYTGWGRGYGQAIFEQFSNGLQAVYGHTSRLLTRAGAIVKAGQQIGLVGSTGHSTGPHLHFEINSPGPFGNSADRANSLAYLNGASVSGKGGGVFSDVLSFLKGLSPVEWLKNKAADVAKGMTGGGMWGRGLANIPGLIIDKGKDFITSRFGALAGAARGVLSKAKIAAVLSTALAMNGLPATPALLGAWMRQVMSESGGNAGITQQITDINSASGNRAQGLLQVIPPTFAAYRSKLLPNDPFNALASAYAGINYEKHKVHGSISRMLADIGHGHGYANGTNSAAPGWAWVGERGPERVWFNGGERVESHSDVMSSGLRDGDRVTLVVEGTPLTAVVHRTMARERYNI